MTLPSDPSRASVGAVKAAKSRGPTHRPNGPVAAREWDVAHAADLRALLSEAPAVLPKQVGDPLLPLRVGIWDALVALLRPEAEPEALARALRAYTRSMGRVARQRARSRTRPPLRGTWLIGATHDARREHGI